MARRDGHTGRSCAAKATKRRKTAVPAPHDVSEPAGNARAEVEKPQLAIVGVGASAGGLDAFTQLLHALPSDPGLAIVFVQHLAPHHESALANLLAMQTA